MLVQPLTDLNSRFVGPLTQLVKRTLQVTNPNNQPVAFKVKTTAPKQYCVRPNSGRIEPGEKVDVQGEYAQSPLSLRLVTSETGASSCQIRACP